MTEQEFAAIRERHRKVAEFPANPKEYHLGLPNSLGEGISVFVTTKHVGVTEHIQKMPDDVASLIRAVEERDAIIHDLQLDGAGSHERIRQAERGEVVDCLRYLLQRKKRQRKAVDLYDIETQIIGRRGIVGNPLPPDQVRAENERLRSALKAIRDQVEEWQYHIASHDGWPVLEAALNRLKEMAEVK